MTMGVGLLGMTKIIQASSSLQNASNASAQIPTVNVSNESQIMCPQVMYTCPSGQSVPLLPEFQCQPQCTSISSSTPVASTPTRTKKPFPTRKPRPTQIVSSKPLPSDLIDPMPTIDTSPWPSQCPRVPVPDLYCLGGMPLEFDQNTCTYKCTDYRMLQQ